jgi:hypothetical protein
MSTNTRYPTYTNKGNVDVYDGYFVTNVANAVSGATDTARGSVARTGAGKYTVSLPIFYKDVFGYQVQLHEGAPDGYFAQVDSVVANSAGKAIMVIGVYNPSFAAADPVAPAIVTWSATVRQ